MPLSLGDQKYIRLSCLWTRLGPSILSYGEVDLFQRLLRTLYIQQCFLSRGFSSFGASFIGGINTMHGTSELYVQNELPGGERAYNLNALSAAETAKCRQQVYSV